MVSFLYFVFCFHLVLGTSTQEENIESIVNGTDADKGEYPWQAQLMIMRDRFVCDGVIYDQTHVLTAAHCVFDDVKPSDYSVLVGNIKKDKLGSKGQRLNVIDAIVHPKYVGRENQWDSDVAILVLKEAMTYTREIRPIKLASKAIEKKALRNKDGVCTVTGFGVSDQFPSYQFPVKLQELDVTMKGRTYCKLYVKTKYNGVFSKNMICSYDAWKGACRGDSGGPVVCDYKSDKVLVGLVSWSDSVCNVGFNVYARVSTLKGWLTKTIENN